MAKFCFNASEVAYYAFPYSTMIKGFKKCFFIAVIPIGHWNLWSIYIQPFVKFKDYEDKINA